VCNPDDVLDSPLAKAIVLSLLVIVVFGGIILCIYLDSPLARKIDFG
jgi:hypothetical protein